jgi:hypothetical protein
MGLVHSPPRRNCRTALYCRSELVDQLVAAG